jgi:hypothetical protein
LKSQSVGVVGHATHWLALHTVPVPQSRWLVQLPPDAVPPDAVPPDVSPAA